LLDSLLSPRANSLQGTNGRISISQDFEKNGSPGRIRTSDQPVNSRLLYR
jgi:hypothetical protein